VIGLTYGKQWDISARLWSTFEDWPNEKVSVIDTVDLHGQWPHRLIHQDTIITIPETTAWADDWIQQARADIQRIADMPADWDPEGVLRPDPKVVAAANGLLERLRDSRFGPLTFPFVCPVAGGGLQFEWTSTYKHLEIELLDDRTVAFLTEEKTAQGEATDSGEYSLADVEKTRELLTWFAAV
jgi:hypothetical protein